jgi:hypothetical protein
MWFRRPNENNSDSPAERFEKPAEQPDTARTGNRQFFGLDRWRRRRVTIRIAVVLEFSENGQPASIPAHTVWVNDEEALLLAPQELPNGFRVELRQKLTGERQSGQLTQAPQKRPDGIYLAMRFDSPVPGFWHILFPPARP